MGQRREPDVRVSYQGLKVLTAFLQAFERDVKSRLAGYDIIQSSGISSGTLYPLLIRFEDEGILESEWETAAPGDLGRPRRRLYHLTRTGAAFARQMLEPIAGPIWGHPRKA